MSDENVIRREFPAVLEPSGDGRTLDLRIVPHGVKARVSDHGGPVYEEEWVRGCFSKQMNAANRVLVNVEHEKGFAGVVGRGIEFRDSDTGFDGSFRVLNGPDGDKALELVNEGVLTGVSLEAVPLKSERSSDGVVRRLAARLLNVSLCRFPAFADAQVMAVREEPDPEPEPEPEPDPEPRVEVDEALTRIGYQPLSTTAVVSRPWDPSRDRFTDEEYTRSCLVEDRLPVLEPNGDLNIHALRDAAKRINHIAPDLKADAARKLIRYYRQADEEPSPMLLAMASR